MNGQTPPVSSRGGFIINKKLKIENHKIQIILNFKYQFLNHDLLFSAIWNL